MRTGKINLTRKQDEFRGINLTRKQKKFLIGNPEKAQNDVSDVNYGLTPIFIGIILGLLLPFLVDWILFSTPFPCQTIANYEDGSSIQACKVRE